MTKNGFNKVAQQQFATYCHSNVSSEHLWCPASAFIIFTTFILALYLHRFEKSIINETLVKG